MTPSSRPIACAAVDAGFLLGAGAFEQGAVGAGHAEAGLVEHQALEMDLADADPGGEADEFGQLVHGFLEAGEPERDARAW